jgi:putative selenium metabolism protein SsnA
VSAVITGGIAVDPVMGTVESRDIGVSGERIGGREAGTGSVDASGCIVMPGNVCSHHHLYSALARGMPAPDTPPRTFPEILERVWWRLDRALDHETIRLSATLGALEAVKAGTTSIVDHHASPEAIDGSLDDVAIGLQEVGARAAICYEVTDRGGTDRARAGIAENVRFIRSDRWPLIRGMMGAHASFTVGDETLSALVGEARDAGAAVHIHLAEDDCDERDSLEKYGVRTAHRLADKGALREGDLVAHGVHLDDSEIETVRASGAWIAHNPRSNMNNGVGYAPVGAMGERVCLGTDGIDGDLFAEARSAYFKARETSPEADPRWALDRVGAGAALVGSVFGEPAMGALEAGAPADLVILEYGAPTPLEAANLAAHFVFGMGAWHVRDVMIAGTWVVRDREHLAVDETELRARCREAAPKLWDRMQSWH